MPSGLIKKYKNRQAISRLKRKDKEVFISAYDEYSSEINRFIYFKVGNREEANDLTSLVFLKTWNHIQNKSLTEAKTLRALFYRIARNIIVDHYREKGAKGGMENLSLDDENLDLEVVDSSLSEEDILEKVDKEKDLELIKKNLNLLKEEYREVIIMRFVNDLSPEEIADISSKSRGAVRVLIHRALKALRELVEDDLEEKDLETDLKNA